MKYRRVVGIGRDQLNARSETVIKIREATIEDIHALRDIGIETYRDHFSDIWSPSGMQHFLSEDFSVLALQESIRAPTHHCWLIALDEDDRAVGFSKVNWSKPMPITGKAGAELQKIYFLKTQAGKGYGKQLLQFIRQLAKDRKEHFIWLDVLKTNASARRFYEGFGFEVLGEIPFSTDKTEIGMVVMCCDISR
nr:N-acetyltransferase [Pseudomonas sp. CVAP\